MFTYASEVIVNRQPADVFTAVNDIEGWTDWTDMRNVRHDHPGPVRVGSAGTFTFPSGPFSGPIRYELTEMEPDRRVVYVMTHPAFDWTAELSVTPDGEGTRLGSSGSFHLKGWRRLLQPIVAREVSRGEADELVRLKAILEASPALAPTTAPQP